ncbi:MAG: phenylacetate--CoA ligase family protein [Syntrophomonadaceae bacterium]|nr:phenylacetate--CoA ligase family protein [Syntrophomonadaceae bacterium]
MVKTPLDNWIAGKIGLQSGVLTRDSIESYQLAQLRKTIALVKAKSAFYRRKLDRVKPEEIVGFTEFAQLPFTTAEDIRKNPFAFVCTSQGDIERVVSLQSSGTTGEPKRIFFTRADQELTIDFFNHGMRNLVGPSYRVLILMPGEAPGSVGDLLRIALERMGACPVPFGPVYHAGEAIEAAVQNQINSIVGIPTHVLRMARHENGKRLSGQIKSILLSADHVSDSIKQVIEKQWGCKVFNHYGMTEMGLGGGVQCEARTGYHMREADLYIEIIDPHTGKNLPEGETGEIVFTTLTREGMPLIRYRTGDISRFASAACPCGSALKVMEVVKGRACDRKTLAGMNFSITDLDEALFLLDGVLDFKCRIETAEGMEYLYLDLLLAQGMSAQSLNVVEQALQSIPAVREGTARNQLKIVTRIHDNEFPVTNGTVKRGIEGNRYEDRY